MLYTIEERKRIKLWNEKYQLASIWIYKIFQICSQGCPINHWLIYKIHKNEQIVYEQVLNGSNSSWCPSLKRFLASSLNSYHQTGTDEGDVSADLDDFRSILFQVLFPPAVDYTMLIHFYLIASLVTFFLTNPNIFGDIFTEKKTHERQNIDMVCLIHWKARKKEKKLVTKLFLYLRRSCLISHNGF